MSTKSFEDCKAGLVSTLEAFEQAKQFGWSHDYYVTACQKLHTHRGSTRASLAAHIFNAEQTQEILSIVDQIATLDTEHDESQRGSDTGLGKGLQRNQTW